MVKSSITRCALFSWALFTFSAAGAWALDPSYLDEVGQGPHGELFRALLVEADSQSRAVQASGENVVDFTTNMQRLVTDPTQPNQSSNMAIVDNVSIEEGQEDTNVGSFEVFENLPQQEGVVNSASEAGGANAAGGAGGQGGGTNNTGGGSRGAGSGSAGS